jgi:exopolysaccharide biosynthesis polyprenyl glycosylphosphotransferase
MRERDLGRTFLLQDVLVVIVAVLLSQLVRQLLSQAFPGLKPSVPLGDYVHLLLIFVPTWALGADRLGLHDSRLLTGPAIPILRALVVAQAWGAVAIAVILVAVQAPLNRSFLLVFFALSTALLAVVKLAQRAHLLHVHGASVALVVGPMTSAVRALVEVGARPHDVLADPEADSLRRRLQAGAVDEVLLSPALAVETLRTLMRACEEAGITALVARDDIDLASVPPRLELLGSTPYLVYRVQPVDQPSRFVKTIADRVAGAVLLVLAAPLLLAIALAVRLNSRGPAFFVQERGGLNGHPFRMYKFRTMRHGAELQRDQLMAANEMDGPVFKIAADPRLTSIGRFLRRTSLDELPQLVNVVRGEMSLVGPRPLPLVETRGLTGPHRRRLSVRPGLTCLWQVSGRNELGFERWMELDLEYVDHWSLSLDFAILLRTVPALLSGRGAR